MERQSPLSRTSIFVVVIVCGVFGHSIGTVSGENGGESLRWALGGGVIGILGLVLSIALRPFVKNLEASRPPAQLLGMRIATLGGLLALSGWLIAIYVNGRVGYWVVALGVSIGGAGILVHSMNLLRKQR
jgi:hypothetical protein